MKQKIKEFLLQDTVPIWWSIATSLMSAIAGAVFVLWVVPHFNSGFENNKIRSAFVLGKLNQLDAASNDVVMSVSQYTFRCSVDPASDVVPIVGELNSARFRLIVLNAEITAMLRSQTDRDKVTALSEQLNNMATPLTCPGTDELDKIATSAEEMKRRAMFVSQVLAKSASL